MGTSRFCEKATKITPRWKRSRTKNAPFAPSERTPRRRASPGCGLHGHHDGRGTVVHAGRDHGPGSRRLRLQYRFRRRSQFIDIPRRRTRGRAIASHLRRGRPSRALQSPRREWTRSPSPRHGPHPWNPPTVDGVSDELERNVIGACYSGVALHDHAAANAIVGNWIESNWWGAAEGRGVGAGDAVRARRERPRCSSRRCTTRRRTIATCPGCPSECARHDLRNTGRSRQPDP